MGRVLGGYLGLVMGMILLWPSGRADAGLSDPTFQAVTIRNNGQPIESEWSEANVGVIQSQTLTIYRTAFLVALPSSAPTSDLQFSLDVTLPRFTDYNDNPLSSPLSPIDLSVVKADPSLGDLDPIQALLTIINTPSTANGSDAFLTACWAVYYAKVFPDTTQSKSSQTTLHIPYTLTAAQLSTPGVVETIDGVSYVALMANQDSQYLGVRQGGVKDTSYVTLNLQSVPEPASVALLGGGFLLAWGWSIGARRRREARSGPENPD